MGLVIYALYKGWASALTGFVLHVEGWKLKYNYIEDVLLAPIQIQLDCILDMMY